MPAQNLQRQESKLQLVVKVVNKGQLFRISSGIAYCALHHKSPTSSMHTMKMENDINTVTIRNEIDNLPVKSMLKIGYNIINFVCLGEI